MHERAFAKQGGTFEMVQLWVNRPRAHKMTNPRYQTLTSSAISKVELGGGNYARVIAGKLGGVEGPAQTFTPVNLFDLSLTRGEVLLTVPP